MRKGGGGLRVLFLLPLPSLDLTLMMEISQRAAWSQREGRAPCRSLALNPLIGNRRLLPLCPLPRGAHASSAVVHPNAETFQGNGTA